MIEFNSKAMHCELSYVSQTISEGIEEMRKSIKEHSSRRAERNRKTKLMIQSLQGELEAVVTGEVKSGDMAFDCLLKLIEDSCSKIQECQLA